MADNAYGFLEVKGLVTGIVAADAMVKSAFVQIVAQIETNPGWITLVVAGDIGACSAAIASGREAAQRVGEVVSDKVMGRPDPDIDIFFRRAPRVAPASARVDQLLDFLRGAAAGKRIDQISTFLKLPLAQTRCRLENYMARGLVGKKQGRYLVL